MKEKTAVMRQDIQFLRGFAVLVVVLYHADVFPVPGGFLGVDVFFVISGFLITTIILRDVDIGRFSFRQFYLRRAKRLLPAAYCTLIITSLLGYIFLTRDQWRDYIFQLIGSVTFSANIFLPLQTGYFESAAEGKPLLHVWSLSLEEQYYIFMPFLIFFIASRWRGWLITVGIFLSLSLCLLFMSFPFTYWRFPEFDSQTLAFFMLPTRAWELLVGSLSAWLMRRSPSLTIPRILKVTAITVLVILNLSRLDGAHPRLDALIVTIATAILLIGRDDWLPLNSVTRAVARIGDWSYSLYLVHWPIFAFAHIGYLGAVPNYIRYFLILMSMLFAYLQYEYVEQRFRYGWQANSRRTFQWLAGASLMVFLVPAPAIIGQMKGQTDLANAYNARQRVLGLNEFCSQGNFFAEPSACMTSAQPAIAVWGDSYAMHLMPGLLADSRLGNSLVQITKSACAPILGVASIDEKYNASWARSCLDFNEKALRFIQENSSIKYVIMSSSFAGYFNYGELSLFHEGKTINGERDIAISQMVTTVEELRRFGKQPIVITPPPKAGFDIGECWARKAADLIVLNGADCNFRTEDYRIYQRGIIDALEQLERHENVNVIWLDKIICGEDVCRTSVASESIYRDGGHLSVAGSEWLIPQLNLANLFVEDRPAD